MTDRKRETDTNGWMDKCMGGLKDGWMDGWLMDIRTNGRMDGWRVGCI